jgi:molybdopterin-guanine dinucleotide biosynthesis protein A
MGQDKAFLQLGDTSLLERAVATAQQVCDPVVLVGDRERLGKYGVVVEDQYYGQGPLAGIQAALTSEFASEWNVILAVDTPAVPAALLESLLQTARKSQCVIAVPRVTGYTQPLCAAYRREFAETAQAALQEGRNKIDPLFATVPTRVVEETELLAAGFRPDMFDNVNTPEDWERMQRRMGARQP